MEMLGVILIAIAAFILIYLLSMAGYFFARIRWANSKYAVELITVGIALAISIGVKIAIICVTAPQGGSIWEVGISEGLGAFYSSFGSLTLEGLGMESAEGLWESLYVASSLYSAIIFLSVVSAKANYEAYSFVRCLIGTERNKHVYVFTALTEDTLALATSISEHFESGKNSYRRQITHERDERIRLADRTVGQLRKKYVGEKQKAERERLKAETRYKEGKTTEEERDAVIRSVEVRLMSLENDWKNGSADWEEKKANVNAEYESKIEEWKRVRSAHRSLKCKIAFAGPTLQPFDRKDELCAKVMANGFLYWSYSDKKGSVESEGKSIPVQIHLKNSNGRYNSAVDKKTNRKKNCENLDYVIFAFETDENQMPLEEENMQVVLNDAERRLADGKDRLFVTYYILSKRQINYSAYSGISKEVRIKRLYSNSEINVWNEANVAAKSLLTITDAVGQHGRSVIGEFLTRNGAPKVRSVGFGEIGQSICKELYVQSASFVDNESYKSNDFIIEAYDPKVEEISGLFQFEHPYFACTNIPGDYEKHVDAIEKFLDSQGEDLYALFDEEKIPRRKVMPYLAYAVKSAFQARAMAEKKEDIRGLMREQMNDGDDLDEMPIPTVCWNAVSAFESRFFEDMDFVTGRDRASKKTVVKAVETFNKTVDREIERLKEKRKTYEIEQKKQVDWQIVRLRRLKIDYTEKEWHIDPPDVFVIATENDFSNVRIANAIIGDICAETRSVPSGVSAETSAARQLMIINLRDSRNNVLIMRPSGVGYNDTVIHFETITVVIVGNSDSLYTYSNTLEHGEYARYNFNYTNIYNIVEALKDGQIIGDRGDNARLEIGQAYALMGKYLQSAGKTKCRPNLSNAVKSWVGFTSDVFAGRIDESTMRTNLDRIGEFINIVDTKKLESYIQVFETFYNNIGEAENEWGRLTMWLKESNRSAYMYRDIMYVNYLNYNGPYDVYAWLCALEHQRWVRMHIAGGWQYSDIRRDNLRLHKCMAPMSKINPTTCMYDLCNVVMAIAGRETGDKEKDGLPVS